MTKKDNDVERFPVEYDTLLTLANESGLQVDDLASYTRIRGPNGVGSIYIAKTKRVSRIDVSGFHVEHVGLRQISEQEAKELRLGKVRAQVDFTKDEGTSLAGFHAALAALRLVPAAAKPEPKPPVERAARTARAPKTEPEAQPSADAPLLG